MKTRNNYDTSSTGINIEFTGYYDNFHSVYLFEENFEILQREGYRTHTIAYYTDYGNVEGASAITFSIKGKRKDFVELLLTECDRVYSKADLRRMKKNQLEYAVKEWIDDTIELINYEDINENQLKDTGLVIIPNKQLAMAKIRGYSQGDYAEVWYCPDDLFKAWGSSPKENSLRETFNHLFWDSPIRATLNIQKPGKAPDSLELYYDECPQCDDYDWKREEFLEWASKQSGVDIKLIAEVVPETLDYNG